MPNHTGVQATRRVVVVDGNTNVLDLLEPALGAGHYDMVFVESSMNAYGEIKKLEPHLVVVCARFDRPDAFQLLTMLKLDATTREIPVLTWTTESDEPDATTIGELAEQEGEAALMRPSLRMN